MIYVTIASYRDPEIKSTIDSLINKSSDPKNIRICVCQQNDTDKLITTEYDNVHFLNFKPEVSKGLCWARDKANSMYNGEEFFLQCDSHMEFVKDWDRLIIEDIRYVKERTTNPAIFAAYPAAYEFTNGERVFVQPPVVHATKVTFRDAPSRVILGNAILNTTGHPVRARFLNGGFVFGDGEFLRSQKFDSEIYFYEEEFMTTLKVFTSGFDLFHPSKHICWHNYHRIIDHGEQVHHWNPDDEVKRSIKWSVLNQKSAKKMDEIIMGVYKGKSELGTIRTIQDYEKYACVDLKNRLIYGDALTGIYIND